MESFYAKILRNNIRAIWKEKYYRNLEKMQEQYDVFLHDMKHTMRTIAALSETGDCDEIGRLVQKLRTTLGNIEWKMICSHKILNALLVERKEYANDNGVILNLDIKEPLNFQNIEDVDIVILIGNLLDNAIEAEKEVKSEDGVSCSIWMSREGQHILIQVENSYGKKRDKRKIRRARKARIGEKHGIGCRSMAKIVKKYGGVMESEKTDSRYRVKIILPAQNERQGSVPDKAKKLSSRGLSQ